MPKLDQPLIITDGKKPYFRKGLIYVPLFSFDREYLLAAPPHVALERAHAVVKAMGAQVFRLGEVCAVREN